MLQLKMPLNVIYMVKFNALLSDKLSVIVTFFFLLQSRKMLINNGIVVLALALRVLKQYFFYGLMQYDCMLRLPIHLITLTLK
jgi:hypothetical protein